jgi:lipoprotein
MGGKMKKNLKIIFIIILSFSCLIGCGNVFNKSENADGNYEKEILKISPEKLYKKAMYDVDLEELIDKRVEIEAKIDKFDKEGASGVAAIYFKVIVKDNLIFDETDNIICVFTNKDEIKKFADLKDGQKVAIRGVIKSLIDDKFTPGDWYSGSTESNIVIENCKLKSGLFWDENSK